MKSTFYLLLVSIVFCACGSTYDKEQLPGLWKNQTWEFDFRADGTCMMGNNGVNQGDQLKYRTFGNTLEISRDGKVVLSGVTVKSLVEDELTLEFRNLVGSKDQMDNLQVLKRMEK